MNAVLDRSVERFKKIEEKVQEEFRGQLTAFCNLYSFLSQIMPYFDEELEQLYAFLRNLSAKLPPPGDGKKFTLDDDVALKFFRLQQVNEGAIDLSQGEALPLKGPTDVGTAAAEGRRRRPVDPRRRSSTSISVPTSPRPTNCSSTRFVLPQSRTKRSLRPRRPTTSRNFSAYFDRVLEDFFIDRMEGNEAIFSRVMSDKKFREAAEQHLAREVYDRIKNNEEAGAD